MNREQLHGISRYALGRAPMAGWPSVNLQGTTRKNRLGDFIREKDFGAEQWHPRQVRETFGPVWQRHEDRGDGSAGLE